MYTVARFVCREEDIALVIELGKMMNLIEKGIFQGIRRKGDGFSCDISKSTEWFEHKKCILEFLRRFEKPIAIAVARNISVAFDTAIRSEDRMGRLMTSTYLDLELLTELTRAKVEIEMTIYSGMEDTCPSEK